MSKAVASQTVIFVLHFFVGSGDVVTVSDVPDVMLAAAYPLESLKFETENSNIRYYLTTGKKFCSQWCIVTSDMRGTPALEP